LVEETPNRLAIATVLANRLFYSINWFSIPPIFFLIARELHTEVSGLGLVASAFLVGIGLFQVPGAILSSKFGPRTMCVVGMVTLSTSALLCAAVSDIRLIAVLRFFSGMGMALFFAPSVVLMTSHSRPGSAGFVLGLNNAVASLGGGIGLFAWALIGDSIGWRLSMVLIGGLGLFSTVFLLLTVPRDSPTPGFQIRLSDIRRVFLDRWLLLVGGVMLAYNVGNTLVSTFAVVYLHDVLGLSAGFSGATASLVVLMGLFSAPIAGRFYRGEAKVKSVLAASGVAIAIGVALVALATPAAVVASAVIVGVASGVGYTFGFGTAWSSSAPKDQRIALSWVNSMQLLLTFWSPYLFSFVVVGYGYELAWLTGALYTAIFIFPLVLSRRRPGPQKNEGRVNGSEEI
jgi:predicted MFS family arabinose efflux permease